MGLGDKAGNERVSPVPETAARIFYGIITANGLPSGSVTITSSMIYIYIKKKSSERDIRIGQCETHTHGNANVIIAERIENKI